MQFWARINSCNWHYNRWTSSKIEDRNRKHEKADTIWECWPDTRCRARAMTGAVPWSMPLQNSLSCRSRPRCCRLPRAQCDEARRRRPQWLWGPRARAHRTPTSARPSMPPPRVPSRGHSGARRLLMRARECSRTGARNGPARQLAAAGQLVRRCRALRFHKLLKGNQWPMVNEKVTDSQKIEKLGPRPNKQSKRLICLKLPKF